MEHARSRPSPGPRRAPGHAPWAVLAFAIALGAVAFRGAMSLSRFEDAGQSRLGWCALILLAASLLFALRKRAYGTLLGPLRPYYLAHVWLGAAVGPVAWLHAGAGIAGALDVALAATLGLAWLSGFLGVLVNRLVLRELCEGGGDAYLLEDLKAARERLVAEVRDLLPSLPEGAVTGLARGKAGGGLPRPLRRAALAAVATLRLPPAGTGDGGRDPSSAAPAPATLLRLAQDLEKLEQVESRIRLHRLRSAWLTLHLAASAPALVLVAAHVWLELRY